MNRILAVSFGVVLLGGSQVGAAHAPLRLVSRPGSQLIIDGGNNVHDWQLKSETIDVVLECGPGFPVATDQAASLGDVGGRMEGSIPVRSLRCGVAVLDRIVYRTLREETNPRLRFRFDDLTLTRLPGPKDPSFLFNAEGELVICGVTHQSRVPVSVRPLGEGRTQISGALDLELSDFGIEPPEFKAGEYVIRTRDAVRATFDWVVGPEPSQTTAMPGAVPPFVAEGSISTSNRFCTTQASFSFFSSNDWWQVALTNFSMPANYQSQDCMRVPGGVRCYTAFSNSTNSPLATAAPITFPPPGLAGGLFEVWLGLCPNPQLPVLEATRMHRFLTVPSAPFDLFKDPVNQGSYQASYLEPGHAFLSQLTITNDGLSIIWNPETNEVRRFSPPFDNGFGEFEYRVLELTNLHGVAFPLKATVRRLGVSPEDRSQHTITMASEINVFRICFDPADLSKQVHPKQLDVLDYRAHASPAGAPVRVITDDQWPAPDY
jgi:hypothetical protein